MLVSVLILTLTRYIVITFHYIISDIFVKEYGCVQYDGGFFSMESCTLIKWDVTYS